MSVYSLLYTEGWNNAEDGVLFSETESVEWQKGWNDAMNLETHPPRRMEFSIEYIRKQSDGTKQNVRYTGDGYVNLGDGIYIHYNALETMARDLRAYELQENGKAITWDDSWSYDTFARHGGYSPSTEYDAGWNDRVNGTAFDIEQHVKWRNGWLDADSDIREGVTVEERVNNGSTDKNERAEHYVNGMEARRDNEPFNADASLDWIDGWKFQNEISINNGE